MMPVSLEQRLSLLANRIEALRNNPHLPAALVDIVSRMVMLQMESDDRLSRDMRLAPPRVTATPEHHAEGDSLVERRTFTFMPEESGKLFGKLLGLFKAVAATAPRAAEAADQVYKELAAGNLSIESACTAVINDDAAWFAEWTARMPEAPEMVRFLAQASITPSVTAQAAMLAAEWQHGALRKPEYIWEYGVCPICGSVPHIGHSTVLAPGATTGQETGTTPENADLPIGAGQARFCTCSFCRHSYRIPVVQCPICQESNPDRLENLTAEEYPDFLVQGCDTCGCYIKFAQKDGPELAPLPIIDDLQSLALDMLAANEGFRRAARSAWGF